MIDDLKRLDEIFNNAKGLWISGLFSEIDSQMGNCEFDEKKDFFFNVLKKWLEEGKVAFCSPDDPLGEIWIESPEKIVEYLKGKWPLNIETSLDEDLSFYFYEIPALLWRNDDGSYVGS